MTGAIASFLETVFEKVTLSMAQDLIPLQALVTSLIAGDLLHSAPSHCSTPAGLLRICRQRDGTTARAAKSSSVPQSKSGPGGKKPFRVTVTSDSPQPPSVSPACLPCASKSRARSISEADTLEILHGEES